jgi:catechol 2,3-dioxygenase-like lactoylglutathione lyase family enzyme
MCPFNQSMPRYELVSLGGHYSSSDTPASLRGMDSSKTALHSLRVHRHAGRKALHWDSRASLKTMGDFIVSQQMALSWNTKAMPEVLVDVESAQNHLSGNATNRALESGLETTAARVKDQRVYLTDSCGGGPMISGAHVVVYGKNAEADRAFFRDVLGFKSVDAGHGWLIFALPPAEAAFHPSDENGVHELYLMCDDLKAEMASLAKKGVKCSEVQEARWGSITKMRLPSGGEVGLYQPKHPTVLGLK